MKIQIYKNFDEYCCDPVRKHCRDTGADVVSPADYTIEPHCTECINLGFGVDVPNGYSAFIMPRTSMAKRGLIPAMCPIDTGYSGPLHAIIVNNSNETQVIHAGDRIAQLVFFPIAIPDFVDDYGDERGAGAFGSTGK